MDFTIYDPTTGKILYNFTCNDQATAEVNLIDCNYITGNYSFNDYYIENNQPVAKGPAPSNNYIFDYTTKSWQLDINSLTQLIKTNRNQLLSAVDRVNPVWYSSLTPEQQNELVVYRQQLLDVPEQSGFPTQVEWPAKPAWL